MKKLYVIVSPDGKTPEQIADIREKVRLDVEEGLLEDIRLMLPTEGIEGVAADVDAIVKSDIVVSTQGSMFNRDCRICNLVASEYMEFGVYEEDWVAGIVEAARDVRRDETEYANSFRPENEE